MRLSEWQQAVEAYLLGGQACPPAELRASLIGSPALDVDQGLAIYHNAYRARLQETLRGDYPALHHWLGDDEFAALAAAYLDAHPSRHFSLRWLGEALPGFIEGHLVPQQSAPLAELARLEWAFTLAFDAPDGHPLSLQTMAELPAEDWPALRVGLLPSVQWQACRHNSLAIWRALKAEAEFPGSAPLPQAEVCLVWRQARISRFRCLSAAEAEALDGMARQGWNFAELCGQLSLLGDGAAPQAAAWLKQWLSDGLLARRD